MSYRKAALLLIVLALAWPVARAVRWSRDRWELAAAPPSDDPLALPGATGPDAADASSAAPSVLAVAATPCSRAIVSADPDQAPMSWLDGSQLRGMAIDYAVRALAELNVQAEVRYVGPGARVVHAARHGTVDVIAGVVKNDELASYLSYPDMPFWWHKVAVFTRKGGRDQALDRWEDLMTASGGALLGMRFDERFQAQADQHLPLSYNSSFELLLHQLLAGRVGYVLYPLESGLAQIKRLGVDGQVQFALPRPGIRTALYLAVAKESPCAPLVPALDRVIRTLALTLDTGSMLTQAQRDWEQRMPSYRPSLGSRGFLYGDAGTRPPDRP